MEVADLKCMGGKTWLSTLSSGQRPQTIVHWHQLTLFQQPSHRAAAAERRFLASLGVSHQEVLQPWVWLWLREMKGQCVGQQIYRAVWGTHTFMNKSCTEPTGLVWLAALTLYSTVNRFTFKLGLDMPEHTHTHKVT